MLSLGGTLKHMWVWSRLEGKIYCMGHLPMS